MAIKVHKYWEQQKKESKYIKEYFHANYSKLYEIVNSKINEYRKTTSTLEDLADQLSSFFEVKKLPHPNNNFGYVAVKCC